MPVVETEVFPVRVEMVCDTCGVGKVRYTGNTKTFGDDVQNQHQCGNGSCGVFWTYSVRYPRIEHRGPEDCPHCKEDSDAS